MIFKEPGYDEFLARQIAQGRAELEAGKGIPLEQAKKQVQSAVEEAIRELHALEVEHSLNYA